MAQVEVAREITGGDLGRHSQRCASANCGRHDGRAPVCLCNYMNNYTEVGGVSMLGQDAKENNQTSINQIHKYRFTYCTLLLSPKMLQIQPLLPVEQWYLACSRPPGIWGSHWKV